MSKLILHSGANAATLEQVFETPTPEPTDTHFPIPHGRLVETVQSHVEANGWEIGTQEFGLWGSQEDPAARMFGVLSLRPKAIVPTTPFGFGISAPAPADYGLVVGIRNSHDKIFAAGLAVGSHVFVCDNLAFSGEIQIARKHTRFVLRDLDRLIAMAIGKMAGLRVSQDRRIACYKETELSDADVHDLVIRSVDARVMANSYIPKVLDEWRNPRHPEFEDRTAWSLFNGYTEVFKATNPLDLIQRTTRLHGMLDLVSGAIDETKEIPEADFEIVGEDTEVRGLVGVPGVN